jgi:cytochrome c biogenesis protein CcmG, thiol:disulfide interchange protein DsbE
MTDTASREHVPAGEPARPRRHPAGRWVAVAVGVVLIAFIAVLATRAPVTDRVSSQRLGKPVPAVQGETLAGGTVDIDDFRGRWVVVNFVASWCIPCKQEHPELVRFSEDHARTGDAVVVAVAYNDDRESLRKFFDERGGDWPVIVGDTARIGLDFGVAKVPETFLVDPLGIVRWKIDGAVTADQLDSAIATASGTAGP